MHVRKVASFEQLIIPYNYCFLGRKHHVHCKILTSWQRKKHIVSVSEKINNCVFYKHLWPKHAIIYYLCNFRGIFLQLFSHWILCPSTYPWIYVFTSCRIDSGTNHVLVILIFPTCLLINVLTHSCMHFMLNVFKIHFWSFWPWKVRHMYNLRHKN